MTGHPAQPLVTWFATARRDLPWREEPREPYRVWVSEVMLQQTRVETVLRYYARFLERFPDVRALAAADEDALMKAWEGLGYYRRARMMQAAARAVVERHGGALPRSVDELRALPGFGPYTSGAVASLAFGLPAPAVDGNVERVYARHEAKARPARAEVERWVMARQPPERAGAFNEALMELGATVCTPRAPRCGACPLAATCRGRAKAEAFPEKRAKRAPRTVRVAVALVRRGPTMLLEKRERGLLAGTWALPSVELEEGEDAPARLARHVAELAGGRPHVSPLVRTGRHLFSHRAWRIEAYEVATDGAAGTWRDPAEVALATAHRKMLR